MRIIDLINTASEHLSSRGFDNARLEVERLLGSVLGLSRIDLYMEFDRPLTEAETGRFRTVYRRRLAHEPLQHILGATGFRDITVKTDRRALVPRSETELLVEAAVAFLRDRENPVAADIGTGSGVIALSIAYEIPEARVVAVDISPEALELAEENARNLGLDRRVVFICGNMLDALTEYGPFDVIVSNPPYVPTGVIPSLQPEVRDYDPLCALDGGGDGLNYIRVLVSGAPGRLKPGGLLILECGEHHAGDIQKMIEASETYAGCTVIKDYTGIERIVRAETKKNAL